MSAAATTLAHLDAWLAACDRALADGADPTAVLAHVVRVVQDVAGDLVMAGYLRSLDLDAAYQAGAWRLPHGCESP